MSCRTYNALIGDTELYSATNTGPIQFLASYGSFIRDYSS